MNACQLFRVKQRNSFQFYGDEMSPELCINILLWLLSLVLENTVYYIVFSRSHIFSQNNFRLTEQNLNCESAEVPGNQFFGVLTEKHLPKTVPKYLATRAEPSQLPLALKSSLFIRTSLFDYISQQVFPNW